MDQNYCDITVLLDRSGSMASIKTDMERGFDNFIAEQKRVPGKCLVTLTQFSTQGTPTLYTALPIAEVPPLTIQPLGGTPLLDAMHDTIVQTGRRLGSIPEAYRPGKVVFIVITDGEENSSVHATITDLHNEVTVQQEHYNWQFLFFGANMDAFAVGHMMGLRGQSIASYGANSAGAAASFAVAASSVGRYRAGNDTHVALTADEQATTRKTTE